MTLPSATQPPALPPGASFASTVAAAGQQIPPWFERLPPEIKLGTLEPFLLERPQASPVHAFSGCNREMARQLAPLRRADATVKALWTAPDFPEFRQAVETLGEIPLRYQSDCWHAAWSALARLSRMQNRPEVEAAFFHLFDRLPADPAVLVQQLHRAVSWALHQGPGIWSSAGADAILRRCAALMPDMPDELWRRLLRLQRATRFTREAPDYHELLATPGLSPAQRGQLELLRGCTKVGLEAMTEAQMLALIGRIEDVEDQAVRVELFRHLLPLLLAANPPYRDVAKAAIDRALLRITDPAQRRQVLTRLRFRPGEAEPATLPAELAAMTPLQALRVLAWQVETLLSQTEGSQLLDVCIDRLLERSCQDPQEHPLFLGRLAKLCVQFTDRVQRQRIETLVLHQCAQLPPWQRLPILEKLEKEVWSCAEVEQAWSAAWEAAVAPATQALRQATTAQAAWPLLLGLLPALPKREGRDAVLRAQLDALPLLDPRDQAQMLERMLRCCLRYGCQLEEGHTSLLIEACVRLPFYLRPPALDKLQNLCRRTLPGEASGPIQAQLAALLEQTAREQQAWMASAAAGATQA
ncbi:hypothetical protein GT347_15815 [Xylophilus rhododendri]|uniref:Uncharacterized protein n=1 Tax=Xylophilus rhododendri TaxID=2697032 RepID=A0A857J7V5_9BURK|nr:hypothetical protein [Xylophilus rhododendri]QHI99313.1 hypothetical protein GT347_15815 [Xylophilus rhododendri]